MSKRDAIRAHYDHRFSPERASHEILDWASAESQRRRFEVLVENVDLRGMKLLDVGCGLGDLLGFLKEHRIAADYTGVDILEKMVRRARRHHPGGRFIHADIFAEDPFAGGRFDVVFCSGTFNLDLGNNLDFLAAALPRLFDLTRRRLVFNLLHRRASRRFRHCFYFDPDEVIALLKPFRCQARVIDDYLENDFTVACTLPD